MANQSIRAAFERMWSHITVALSGKANTSDVPTKTSDLTNDSGFITALDVPEGAILSVNGKTGVVEINAEDIGLGNVENKSSETIRSELTKANVTNALGYTPPTQDTVYTHPSSHAASMITGLAAVATSGKYSDLSGTPTIPTVNNATLTIQKNGTDIATFTANSATNATANITVPTKASDVGAEAAGTVSAHNTANNSHNDIRLLIEGLTTRLNTLANSTDEDLDQMAEIVAYIKNNKSLIESITTSKVSVADIINNLTTNVTNKPLSAAQGVAIKKLIDDLQASLSSYAKITDIPEVPANTNKPDAASTTKIYSITSVGTLPSASHTASSLTASVANQCLTLIFTPDTHSFNAGALPTRSSEISIPNADHTHSITATNAITSN